MGKAINEHMFEGRSLAGIPNEEDDDLPRSTRIRAGRSTLVDDDGNDNEEDSMSVGNPVRGEVMKIKVISK